MAPYIGSRLESFESTIRHYVKADMLPHSQNIMIVDAGCGSMYYAKFLYDFFSSFGKSVRIFAFDRDTMFFENAIHRIKNSNLQDKISLKKFDAKDLSSRLKKHKIDRVDILTIFDLSPSELEKNATNAMFDIFKEIIDNAIKKIPEGGLIITILPFPISVANRDAVAAKFREGKDRPDTSPLYLRIKEYLRLNGFDVILLSENKFRRQYSLGMVIIGKRH